MDTRFQQLTHRKCRIAMPFSFSGWASRASPLSKGFGGTGASGGLFPVDRKPACEVAWFKGYAPECK